MSTRTRIILMTPEGGMFTGQDAIQYICLNAQTHILGTKFPENWPTLSKRAKLAELVKRLKVGHVLTLVQERKHTRKARSLYWAKLKIPMPQMPNVAPQMWYDVPGPRPQRRVER